MIRSPISIFLVALVLLLSFAFSVFAQTKRAVKSPVKGNINQQAAVESVAPNAGIQTERSGTAESKVGDVEESPVPTIVVNPDVYYPLDEVLYIEGRSIQNTIVEIRFSKQGSKPRTFRVKSDPNGEWVLAERVQLEAGDWEVRSRLFRSNTLVSEWSNPRVFKVIITGFTIGGVNIKFAVLALSIVVILILGIAVVFFFAWRVRRLKAALLSKEIREAHESVREGLSALRNDLLEELRLIESSGRVLTPAEISRKEHILKEIQRVETNTEREIGDIEEKL